MNNQRATCWSVTINNPVESDKEAIATAGQKRWTVTGQLEKGANGTPHYQLIVRTPQVRFAAIKKQFPRAHIEIAHHPEALAKYVVKDETRVASLSGTDRYPSQAKTMLMFWEHVNRCAYDFSPVTPPATLLKWFDDMVGERIKDGYFMELIAMNPQVRSAIRRFGYEILVRQRRQTDRQTTENVVAVKDITNGREIEDL